MLFHSKRFDQASAFKPENLLREARRQKDIPNHNIPPVCVLDPDGDIVQYLLRAGKASLNPYWAGYHTQLYEFDHHGQALGIIGCAVGASFAVLVAEQLFVSGCECLISITSAGIIHPPHKDIKFILIQQALRDEGTSYHYLAPQEESRIQPELLRSLSPLLDRPESGIAVGDSWTTDAPYRETPAAIAYAKTQGVNAVEMEAAALYAFAQARGKCVICFAHLTNQMAQSGDDFEKGVENGSIDALELIFQTLACLKQLA